MRIPLFDLLMEWIPDREQKRRSNPASTRCTVALQPSDVRAVVYATTINIWPMR